MSAEHIVHPGTLLEPLLLRRTGLSQSALSRHLGFNQPQPVNEMINGRRGVTPKMALLLERLTEGEYPAEFWLLAQMRWDLVQAKETIPPARAALVQPAPLKGDLHRSLQTTWQDSLFEISAALKNIA